MANKSAPKHTHVFRALAGDLGPPGAFALLSTDDTTKRIVVFVHGFMGSAGGTWVDFSGQAAKWNRNNWWQTSDLFFYTYPSVRQATFVSAQDLCDWLKQVFPTPNPKYFELSGKDVPADYFDLTYDPLVRSAPAKYDEIVLVGHSEGGFILRQVGVLFTKPGTADTAFHRAKLRLFAPALFRPSPSGFLGFLAGTPIGRIAYTASGASASYRDMTNRDLVISVKSDTENLANSDIHNLLLRALILWGKKEQIVGMRDYLTDTSWKAIPGHTHTPICKPKTTFQTPLEFVSA